jgi:hypothetical protein
MTESRKANPNATNSELDAKVIIQHPNITSKQREDVIEQFVEIVVDGMDTKDLVRYVSEQLTEYYEDCTNVELKEFVDNYDEDLFEELVDNSNHINQNPQKVYGGTK